MKPRRVLLIAFLVITAVIGFTTLQDSIFIENQHVDINQISSEVKSISVKISDGVGFGDK